MRKTIDELVVKYSEPAEVIIKADDLGLLAYCAADWDLRLTGGDIPPGIWDLLPQRWRDKINGLDKDTRYEERA